MESGRHCGKASLWLSISLICAHTHWCTRILLIRYEHKLIPLEQQGSFIMHLKENLNILEQEALQEFVSKHNRSRELHSLPDQVYILDENAFFNDTRLGKKERRRLNITSALRKSLSFSLPGTKLSVDFFKDQVGPRRSWCNYVFCMIWDICIW